MRIRAQHIVYQVKGTPTVRAEGSDIIDQAIAWHVTLAEGGEADWARFVDWLEASPAHAEAYDRVAMQDHAIGGAHFPEPAQIAGNDNVPGRRYWLWVGSGLAVAAAIAVVVAPSFLVTRSSPYEVATRQGQQRSLALEDGTRIDMSGGTRLRLDHADPRVATLEGGEALFHVRHDPQRPFTLTASGDAIRDLGTVFNVSSEGHRISLAVSEGAVLFQPASGGVALNAGEALVRDGDGRVVRSTIDPDAVGGWRKGMLSFDGQPLGEVAATLNRLYAVNLSVEGNLSLRPFTGMVRLTGAADRDIPHLAALIGTKWRRDGARWILSDSAPASR